MTTLTRQDPHRFVAACRPWFEGDGPEILSQLAGWADATSSTPEIAEALSGYVCTHAVAEQERLHPDGRIERVGLLQPTWRVADLDHPRLFFMAAAWYDSLTVALRGALGEWEAWSRRGGYRCVWRDGEGDRVVAWTVRDVGVQGRSLWAMHCQTDSGTQDWLSFALPNDLAERGKQERPTGSAPADTLLRAYLGFVQRSSRVLALLQHLDAIGVESTEEYRDFCSRHRLSADLIKGQRQRRLEIDAAATERGGADREAWFAQLVGRLHNGTADPRDLRTAYLQRLSRAFDSGLAGGARDAFRDLLLHCQRRAHFGGTRPVIESLGERSGNTWIEALAELARCHRRWRQPVATWLPSAQDPTAQFRSLARHLLAEYDVPAFMDCAWFAGRRRAAQQQRAWFLHLGSGGNIRTAADLPLVLSKRMAHQLAQAPADYTIEQALRWAQIVGQGGNDELAQAILATPLGTSFENEPFWATVVTWWVKQTGLDADWVGPVYDFIQYRKFEPRQIALPGGDTRIEDPPEPNFSMKSRSVPKLMEAINAWHIQLSREARAAADRGWLKSNIPDFEYEERDPEGKLVATWQVAELTTNKQLFTEGRQMRHCVSSYASRCRSGKESVWSLQVSDEVQQNRRLATVALDPRTRTISQLRGRLNLMANDIRRGKGGVDETYSSYVARGRRILSMWVRQNSLGRKDGVMQGWMG